MFPPNQNPGAAPIHLISIHISIVICTMLNVQTLSQFQNLKKITDLHSLSEHVLAISSPDSCDYIAIF